MDSNVKLRRLLISFVPALILLLVTSPAWTQQKADLTRLVVVGDSLSAGYQNGSLLGTQQVHGYANLVATQAQTPLILPLIADPGVPSVLQIVSLDPLIIQRAPGTSTGRIDLFTQPTDLAVVGHTVNDALTLRPDFPIDSLTDLVLGFPGLLGGVSRSQVEWAEMLQPTTMIVWLGSNDSLNTLFFPDPAALTPVPVFEAQYIELMNRVSATGATIVVANVPDVTVLPYLTSAEKVAAQVGVSLAHIGPILGIAPGDYVTPDAFPLIQAILTGMMPGPLPGNVVMTAAEVTIIRDTTDAYNAIIAAQAQARGIPVVDVHTLLLKMQARGFVVNGQRLTTDFLGGLFSLDGIHPTNTGYAIVANEFIHVFNTHFDTDIPPVSIAQIAKDDPLVLPGVGRPASALGHIKPETVQALRAVFAH